MRVYIGNTGHIKKSSKIQNFILVPGVQKTDFLDFSGIFTIKMAGNPGISSETTPCRAGRARLALYIVTDFPFYGFLRRGRAGHQPGNQWRVRRHR